MYLHKVTYVRNWQHDKENSFEVTVTKDGNKVDHINSGKINTVKEEAIYWRKANAIHNWFVNNVQDGIDDCGTHEVPFDDLKELLNICEHVLVLLENKETKVIQEWAGYKNGGKFYRDLKVYEDCDVINELLPPTAGFFFGSDEIDEYYKEYVENTVNELKQLISNRPEEDVVWYEYSSSW